MAKIEDVPDDLQDKMASCVKKIMANNGGDEAAAIAMCRRTIVDKKDWYEGGEMASPPLIVPSAGALTFEELEAARLAQAQAEAAHELTAQFQALISSTLAAPQVGDKGFAIVRLASEFRKRLDALLSGMGKALTGDKAGARHSARDQGMLQQVHDNAVSLGAMCEAMQAGKARGAFLVTKDRAGDYRWIGVYSNRYEDLDGEIIPEAAHKEFLSYLDAHPEAAPEWWTWHIDVGRKSRADWWGLSDGFVFVSGTCTAEQAAPYLGGGPLGMSHGFHAVKDGRTIPLYRTFEVSDLPLDNAANPWTAFDVVAKEATVPFDPKRRAYFVEKLGEEKVTELEAGSAATGKALIDADVAFKQLRDAQSIAPPAQGAVVVDVPAQIAAVLEPVVKALEAANLHAAAQDAQIAELLLEVKALKVTEDERIAEVFRPRAMPFAKGVSASATDQTVIDEAKAKALVPDATYSWLQNVGPLT